MVELASAMRTLQHVKGKIDEEDYTFLVECWKFLGTADEQPTSNILRHVPYYIAMCHQLRGKYETAMQQADDRIKEYVASMDKSVRRQLRDDTWNSERGSYEVRITESMVNREIQNQPEYKRLVKAQQTFRFTFRICKALAHATDAMQFTATELARIERREFDEDRKE